MRWAAPDVLTAAAYTALCLLGRSLHLPDSHLAVVWPAAGVAVLWVARHRRWSRRVLVVAVVGVVVATVCQVTGTTGWAAVLVGVANACAAATAVAVAEVLQRGPLRLRRTWDVWALAAGALSGAAVSTLLSPAVLLLVEQPHLLASLAAWLVRSFTGSLVVAGVGLRLLQRHERAGDRVPGSAGPREAALHWVVGAVVFAGVFVALDGVAVGFAALPVAVLAALRLPSRASSVHLLLGGATVVAGTVVGRGPFAEMALELGVVTAQLFVAVLALVVLSISLHHDELGEATARLDRALAEVGEERALLQAVHHAVEDGIAVFSADGTCLLRNPAADRLLGVDPHDRQVSSREGDYTFRTPEGGPTTAADLPVARALAGREVLGVDLVIEGPGIPGGRLFNVDAHPLPDVPAVWSRGAVAVFHDVTEERAAAADSARTRDLLAGVLDGATEQGIVATGPDGRITVFSSGAERLLGWSAAEVVGGPLLRFHRLAEVHERAAELGTAPGPGVLLHGLSEHGHTTRRWTFVRRDGTTFTAELTLTQAHDEDGAVLATIGVFTDVTAQIAAEQRLADSEEQFRLAFETAPTGMLVARLAPGEAGLLSRVNDAFTAFTGRRREELLGRPVSELLHPDDVAGHLERLDAIADHRGVVEGAGGVEQRFVHADGSLRWGRTSPSVIQPSDGSPPHLLVVVEDVTERHAAQEALRHAALHDPLTGLPNRALLADRLQQALVADDRDGVGVTVVFVDLDGFKPVNDEHGHAAGDAVLRELAGRLSDAVRAGDTVARMGGDEFAVVCPRLPAEDAGRVVERLEAAFAAPVALPDGTLVRLSASTGTATTVGGQDAAVGAERLLDEADHRMYAAKRRRRLPAPRPTREHGPVADSRR